MKKVIKNIVFAYLVFQMVNILWLLSGYEAIALKLNLIVSGAFGIALWYVFIPYFCLLGFKKITAFVGVKQPLHQPSNKTEMSWQAQKSSFQKSRHVRHPAGKVAV